MVDSNQIRARTYIRFLASMCVFCIHRFQVLDIWCITIDVDMAEDLSSGYRILFLTCGCEGFQFCGLRRRDGEAGLVCI